MILKRVSASQIIAWCYWFSALCFALLWFLWFVDGEIRHSLVSRFESTPPEGWNYWYWKEAQKEAVWGIIVLSPLVIGLVTLIDVAVETLRRPLPGFDDEQVG